MASDAGGMMMFSKFLVRTPRSRLKKTEISEEPAMILGETQFHILSHFSCIDSRPFFLLCQ